MRLAACSRRPNFTSRSIGATIVFAARWKQENWHVMLQKHTPTVSIKMHKELQHFSCASKQFAQQAHTRHFDKTFRYCIGCEQVVAMPQQPANNFIERNRARTGEKIEMVGERASTSLQVTQYELSPLAQSKSFQEVDTTNYENSLDLMQIVWGMRLFLRQNKQKQQFV